MTGGAHIAFEWLGIGVCIIGTSLVIGFLVDHALAQWLRLTRSMKLFLRFAWLDGNLKQQMRADMEYEARERAKRYEPDPIDSSADDDEDANVPATVVPPPTSEDACHPLTREVPLTTKETPVTILMEAAAAAFEARQYSLPFGSDEGILDSDQAEATSSELSDAAAPPARKAEDIVDRCSLEIFEYLLAKGYLMPAEGLREFVRRDLEGLIGMLLTNTPRRSMGDSARLGDLSDSGDRERDV